MFTIARLNDEFRSTLEGGKVLITAVNALPAELRSAALVAVQASTVFTKDDDPYEEHDWASFTLNAQTLLLDDRPLR
jgi:hypothetical protein